MHGVKKGIQEKLALHILHWAPGPDLVGTAQLSQTFLRDRLPGLGKEGKLKTRGQIKVGLLMGGKERRKQERKGERVRRACLA